MIFLILESLGSTELVFILVMALVFFGPRKLPQLSRSMGKHLAEFRRASEDFKRTWDREVSLEEIVAENPATPSITQGESAYWETDRGQSLQPPTIEAVAADRVVPRQGLESTVAPDLNETGDSGEIDESDLSAGRDTGAIDPPEPSRKRDWL